jgi:hypothetical protein
MLTESQERRLRDALTVLVEAAPDSSEMTVASRGRRQTPALVGAVAFVLVLAVFLPLWLMQGGNGPASEPNTTTPATETNPSTTSSVEESNEVSFGEPIPLTGTPGGLASIDAVGDVLYAASPGESDGVLRSADDGVTWEKILEADPGDAEGLFSAGAVVALVIEDDNPARDTVSPSSVVSEAPRVLVFDPATGARSETLLPRPDDPEMGGLSLEESTEGCALGGYQSWVRAEGVAVGDRLVVTGNHQLVGRLADGAVICDSQVYRYLAWTSDDRGKTWDLHEVPPLGAIAWTGERFIGWSMADTSGRFRGAPDGLVVSSDGVTWTSVVSTPAIPEGSIFSETSIDSAGDTVVALAGVHRWTAKVPDDVTDPEQLRDVLNIGDDDELEIEQVLEMIGVDLPLDAEEEEKIARFNGGSEPAGAVIAVSNDRGLTWSSSYVPQPVTGVVAVDGAYVALTSGFGEPSTASDESSSLLTSTDAISWSHGIELPEFGYGPRLFVATESAIYVRGEESGNLWMIPTS